MNKIISVSLWRGGMKIYFPNDTYEQRALHHKNSI